MSVKLPTGEIVNADHISTVPRFEGHTVVRMDRHRIRARAGPIATTPAWPTITCSRRSRLGRPAVEKRRVIPR